MILAIAALLIQPQVAPQLSISAEKIAIIQPAISAVSSSDILETSNEISLPPAPSASAEPIAATEPSALPDAPVPSPAVNAPVTIAFIKPSNPMTVSVNELAAENHRKQFVWKGLVIASSGAATFDAWTTRHAITTAGAVELNPMLKPFAGNASLYAAIQVGPALMDYVGKKMMYSRFTVVRRMWWVPQSASFVSSLFCGAHNLSFH
ncbi:MAG: hypothetical protein ABSA96_00060 [Candidatus Acidiferrales bacterium]|jgi:hypothetical protein